MRDESGTAFFILHPSAEELQMKLSLKIWRQKDTDTAGRFVTYPVDNVSGDMSFLEMLDVLNEELTNRGEEPVAFEHDCREGICGSCGFLIDGVPHGPRRHTTVCQLHMRFFEDGDSLTLELRLHGCGPPGGWDRRWRAVCPSVQKMAEHAMIFLAPRALR